MAKTQKDQNFQLMITLMATLGLLLAIFFVFQQTDLLNRASSRIEPATIKSDQDLNSALKSLDSTEMNSLDSDVNMNTEEISDL